MLNAEVVNWDYFDELIEVIAKIEELAFEHLILEEC